MVCTYHCRQMVIPRYFRRIRLTKCLRQSAVAEAELKFNGQSKSSNLRLLLLQQCEIVVWAYLQPLIISLLFQAKCICEAEEKYESLSKTLDPDLSLNYWRRCEEATKEVYVLRGLNSGHAYGTWTIPCVIADEDSFRAQSVNKKSRGS
uniref:Uncharacterized protein n=1 Tax=Ananas comosus var. bracteatus TaxID=296719 RepID=A0A6V7PVZ8_ANACO|nr:unnamed protein product [Ananas comosus var. bracteatus]